MGLFGSLKKEFFPSRKEELKRLAEEKELLEQRLANAKIKKELEKNRKKGFFSEMLR